MKATETEIKLTVPDRTVFEEILSLDSIAGLRLEDRGLQPHRDIYFDTADLLLYRSKVVFRIREKNGRQVLTFKAQAPSDGAAYRRIEIEETITIDLERGTFPASKPLDALLEHCGAVTLAPCLTVDNNRHVLMLSDGNTERYELVLDDVTFHGRVGDGAMLELEVEMRGGNEDELHRIGLWLEERFRLNHAGPSKYISGMDLAGIARNGGTGGQQKP